MGICLMGHILEYAYVLSVSDKKINLIFVHVKWFPMLKTIIPIIEGIRYMFRYITGINFIFRYLNGFFYISNCSELTTYIKIYRNISN